MTNIISSRMLSALRMFYSSTVTIQTTTYTADGYGEPLPVAWTELALHADQPCAISPSGGREVKRADGTITIASHSIEMAGYYPTITTKMRAVVGGVTYDILSVEHDSQQTTTKLTVQVVT